MVKINLKNAIVIIIMSNFSEIIKICSNESTLFVIDKYNYQYYIILIQLTACGKRYIFEIHNLLKLYFTFKWTISLYN